MGHLTSRQRISLAVIAIATAAAGTMHYADAAPVVTFLVATVALAGLAWIVSFSTEAVGERLGPAATGFLQSTLGNLPEFFIVIFALSKGEIVVARNSIIGSIFANALLVLGIVLVVGRAALRGRPHALPRALAERHRDAAAARELHHRDRRAVDRLERQGQPPHQRDLGDRRVPDPGRLRGVGLRLHSRRQGPVRGTRGRPRPAGPARPRGRPAAGQRRGAAFVSDWFVPRSRPPSSSCTSPRRSPAS